MASPATNNQSLGPVDPEAPQHPHPYPSPIAKFEDVITCPKLFMDTLGKFHAAMGTKFMIPIIGGKDLDLHRLFAEVTSRGGIERVLREKKWKEVTTVFSFPPSATNASFILRKYYLSLLHHYEQVYYFNEKWWTPSAETQMAPLKQQKSSSADTQVTPAKRQRLDMAESLSGATPEPSIGSPVIGVIDGKIEFGYLCTVTIGSEQLRGVLYQSTQDSANQILPHQHQCQNASANPSSSATAASVVTRRRRRKKSEMKKRDPAHPKPNRSGYNFFFADQRARLKPLHPGKDREISRMIGELWGKITTSEKEFYDEKAARDKERYQMELEQYKVGLRTGQIISNAVPLQQRPVEPDVNMVELDENIENEGGASPHSPENELTSGNSEKSSCEDDNIADKGSNDMGMPLRVEIVGMETLANKEAILLQNGLDKIKNGVEECLNDVQMEAREELLLSGEKKSVNIEDTISVFTEERVQQKSVPIQATEAVGSEKVIEKESVVPSPIQEQEQEQEPVCSEKIVEKESTPIQEKESEGYVEIPWDDSKVANEEREWEGIEDRTETEPAGFPKQESVVFEDGVEKEFAPIQGKLLVGSEEREEHEPFPAQDKEPVTASEEKVEEI